MTKITDPDYLRVGIELSINLADRVFALYAQDVTSTGYLTAKDGVTAQAVYSKFIELWTTSTYNKYPFPGYVIGDPRAGMFAWGFDGASYNGWAPSGDDTRSYLRDAGFSEYNSTGGLTRQYVGIVSLGDLNSGSQPYYQRAIGGPARNTTFTDETNEAIQVFGDISGGAFNEKDYFKLFCREYGYTYAEASLSTIGESNTGPFKIGLPLSNAVDIKIQAADSAMTGATYTGITVAYYNSSQYCPVGGIYYPFNTVISANNATAENVYTKIQYLLRSTGNINRLVSPAVTGKTASALLSFVGDTLYTENGVYISGYNSNDINRLVFTDQSGVERTEPFTAAGTFNFNSFLTQDGDGYYRVYFASVPSGDYGTSSAVTVKDASDVDMAGLISSSSIPFTFAYDSNAQGGRTASTDAAITIVAGNPSSAKPAVTTYTLTRTVGQTITITAEQDRGYVNP